MKEKIKKILLWVVLIISVFGFVGKLIDTIWFVLNPSSPSTNSVSVIGMALYGLLGLFCIKKLNIFVSLKVGKKTKTILTILGWIFVIFLFLVALLIHGERTTRNLRQQIEQEKIQQK